MKIALSFPGCHRRGGVERVMLEAANFLESRGHETHVFASEWDETLHAGVVRHEIAPHAKSSSKKVTQFIAASHPALKAMQPPPDGVGSFGVLAPPNSVVWMQSVHRAWLEISRRERDWKGRLKQKLNPFHGLILRLEREQLQGRHYAHVVALTDVVKQDIMRFYGVPDEDITVIPNGFAPQEFNVERRHMERDPMRRKLGFAPDDKVVIFVANELERKGFGPLLEAVASLHDNRVHVLAVGRLNPAECQAQISRLNLDKQVHFTGPSSDVASFYAASDVFALPTQYEAWGLVIVEAMACGLPVLTSRLAGAAIAVRERCSGYLLDQPRDADEIAGKLRLLLDGVHASPEEIADSVIEYSWSQILPRYEEVLMRYGANGQSASGAMLSRAMSRDTAAV